jgi:hypothetical protein
MIKRLEKADFVDLASAVFVSKQRPDHTKTAATAFSVYERLDKLVFRLHADGFELTDLSSNLSSKTSETELDVLINLAWPTMPTS